MPERSRAGSGPVAFLLVHASPGDATQWAGVEPGLRGSGEVLRLDLPDYGLAPDDLSVDPDDTVEHIRQIVRTLAPRPVVLGGTSFGAYLIARLLEGPPEHVTGALLASGFPSLSEAQSSAYQAMADRMESGQLSMAEFAALAAGLFLGTAEGRSGMRSGLEHGFACLPPARVARGLRRAAACARPDRRVRHLARPAIVLHGRDDVAMPLAAAEALAALGSTRLEVLDTTSHLLPRTHPEACTRALLELTL
jgi:pimeloyl-ACP methyl ester carboxylesterase